MVLPVTGGVCKKDCAFLLDRPEATYPAHHLHLPPSQNKLKLTPSSISLFSSPASPVPRPPTLLARLRAAFLSLLRLPITLLLRLFPRLFPRPLPSPPAPQYNNLWSDSEYDNPWSDSEYDNPWSDSEDEGSEHDDAHGQV